MRLPSRVVNGGVQGAGGVSRLNVPCHAPPQSAYLYFCYSVQCIYTFAIQCSVTDARPSTGHEFLALPKPLFSWLYIGKIIICY